MPDPITWYALGKAVDDPTTIEEQIDADILNHNQDPSAHGQDSESLYEHRIAPLLDHLNYSIYNIKTGFQARTVKAFVGEAGVADFEDIQEAIDYVNLHGGGRVFIQNCVYYPTADITVPSNIWLEGESMEDTIIDFNGGAFNVDITGVIDELGTGTISLTTDDATVTGAGTSFESEISAGDFIRVDDSWYEVDSVTDDTHLELVVTFRGDSQAGLSFSIMTPKTNLKFSNFTVRGSSTYGLYIKAVKDVFVEKVTAFNPSGSGGRFSWMFDCSVRDFYGIGNDGYGVLIDNCQSTYFLGLSVLNNNDHGLQVQGTYTNGLVVQNSNASHNDGDGMRMITGNRCSYISCSAIGNDDDGISIDGVDYSNVIACYCEKNGGDGISFESGVSYAKITNNTCVDNVGWGINIPGGLNNNHKEIVLGNVVLNNTAGQINDATGDSEVDHNIVA